MGIFSKKSGCHTQLYMGPYHHAKFQKKLMSQYQENVQTDGRTEGQTDAILRNLPAKAGGPIKAI